MYSQGHNKPSFSMQQHSAHRKAPTLGAAAPPLLPPPGSPAAAPPAVARPATMAPAPAAAPQRPQAAAVGAERHWGREARQAAGSRQRAAASTACRLQPALALQNPRRRGCNAYH